MASPGDAGSNTVLFCMREKKKKSPPKSTQRKKKGRSKQSGGGNNLTQCSKHGKIGVTSILLFRRLCVIQCGKPYLKSP